MMIFLSILLDAPGLMCCLSPFGRTSSANRCSRNLRLVSMPFLSREKECRQWLAWFLPPATSSLSLVCWKGDPVKSWDLECGGLASRVVMHEIMGIQQAKVTSPPPPMSSKGSNAETKTKQPEGNLKCCSSRSTNICLLLIIVRILEGYQEINLSVIWFVVSFCFPLSVGQCFFRRCHHQTASNTFTIITPKSTCVSSIRPVILKDTASFFSHGYS